MLASGRKGDGRGRGGRNPAGFAGRLKSLNWGRGARPWFGGWRKPSSHFLLRVLVWLDLKGCAVWDGDPFHMRPRYPSHRQWQR